MKGDRRNDLGELAHWILAAYATKLKWRVIDNGLSLVNLHFLRERSWVRSLRRSEKYKWCPGRRLLLFAGGPDCNAGVRWCLWRGELLLESVFNFSHLWLRQFADARFIAVIIIGNYCKEIKIYGALLKSDLG